MVRTSFACFCTVIFLPAYYMSHFVKIPVFGGLQVYQPVQLHRLILDLASVSSSIEAMNNKGSDQTAWSAPLLFA